MWRGRVCGRERCRIGSVDHLIYVHWTLCACPSPPSPLSSRSPSPFCRQPHSFECITHNIWCRLSSSLRPRQPYLHNTLFYSEYSNNNIVVSRQIGMSVNIYALRIVINILKSGTITNKHHRRQTRFVIYCGICMRAAAVNDACMMYNIVFRIYIVCIVCESHGYAGVMRRANH